MESRVHVREIDQLSGALARGSSQGLAKGARVALMMPNLPQYMVASRPCFVPDSSWQREPALHRTRARAPTQGFGCEAIIVLENFAKTLEEVIRKTNFGATS